MRTRLGTTALACAALLMVAGCNGTSVTDDTGGDGGDGQDGKGEVTGKLQLTFWGGANRAAKTNAVADMFVKAHSGVTIDRQNADFGNYFNKLNIQASSKRCPASCSCRAASSTTTPSARCCCRWTR